MARHIVHRARRPSLHPGVDALVCQTSFKERGGWRGPCHLTPRCAAAARAAARLQSKLYSINFFNLYPQERPHVPHRSSCKPLYFGTSRHGFFLAMSLPAIVLGTSGIDNPQNLKNFLSYDSSGRCTPYDTKCDLWAVILR